MYYFGNYCNWSTSNFGLKIDKTIGNINMNYFSLKGAKSSQEIHCMAVRYSDGPVWGV